MDAWGIVGVTVAYSAAGIGTFAKVGVTEEDMEEEESLRSDAVDGGEGTTGASLVVYRAAGDGMCDSCGVGINTGCCNED